MNLRNQCNIFSIFHDGVIEEIKYTDNGIRIKVGIIYLAEMISERFEYIYVDLIDCAKFEFFIYETDKYETDFKLISELKAEILNCKIFEDEYLKMFCVMNIGEYGELLIKTKNIMIYDETNHEMPMKYLTDLCDRYWKSK